jgi:hypothetical protein
MVLVVSRRPITADAYCCGSFGRKIGVVTGFPPSTVVYARTKDPTTKEFYNEEFLSIKSGCYNERFFYAFVMESSIIDFNRERFFMLFTHVTLFMLFIRESLFIVFTKVKFFMLFIFIL